jgi:hypothetical protein
VGPDSFVPAHLVDGAALNVGWMPQARSAKATDLRPPAAFAASVVRRRRDGGPQGGIVNQQGALKVRRYHAAHLTATGGGADPASGAGAAGALSADDLR